MSRLFEEPPDARSARPPADDEHVVAVAVAANVWRAFDYRWPAGLGEARVGQRVRVPLGRGNRPTMGFVTEAARPASSRELKAVREVVDPEPQLDAVLWDLGGWISEYYLSPLGMTLSAMVPSAVGRHAAKTEAVVYLTQGSADWPARLGAKQRRILEELLEARKQGVEPVRLESLLHHSEASRDTIKRLRSRDLVRIEHQPVVLEGLQRPVEDATFDLNEDQRRVWEALQPKLPSPDGRAPAFSVTLLHGVTGSGKTEVYIRAVRRVIDAGLQAIVMVPEIALATQTLERLARRLPRVAVLHSGLTDAQRAFYYEQIRDGHASVVLGPRSAVFAPTRKLALIIVDEEHESSYKQDNLPRYHGRDVAVKRAALAGVPVLLGSATPSLESHYNAQQGRYDLLRLPHRVRGLPMPRLQIVPLRHEMERGRIELIGKTLTHKMAMVLDRGEQVILLMNRRGYASHVFCPSCQWVHSCPECTRAMVWHRSMQLVLCHYCQHTEALPEACPACGGKIILFGMGIQRIEDELARKFPTARFARVDSDTMTSPKQFQKVFEEFSSGKLDILLGTQMVAKGLDFPRVSLVGVASADTSLTIPDFRASERTFQLIVQVAGRAGRGETGGEVIVQTLHAEEPAVQLAARHDYDSFAEWDLKLRREMNLPPVSRLVRFLARHEKPSHAEAGAHALAEHLRRLLPAGQYSMMGPMPASVLKIRGQFRFHVLLTVAKAGLVQHYLKGRMEEITRENPAEVVADVDPTALM